MGIIKMQYVKAKELEHKGIVTILPSQLVDVAVDELPKSDFCIECQKNKKCTIQYRLHLKDVVTFKCTSYKSKEK